MSEKLFKRIIYVIYPFSSFVYFAYLCYSGVRTGITITAALLIGAVCIAALKLVTFKTLEDKLFALYLAYNIVSGIWCVYYGIPMSVYLGEISTTALPMVFYYIGRGFDKKDAGNFYVSYIIAALFMGFIGLIMHIWAPQFYIDYSFVNSMISKADAATTRVRMNSLVGSGELAVLETYSVCASAFFIRCKDKKQRIFGFVTLIWAVIFSFLANQRSGMFCVITGIAFFILVDYLTDRTKSKKPIFIEFGVIIAAVIGIFIFARDVFDKYYIRIASIPQGFSERSESWVAAVNDMHNMWLGDGLGSRGHRAEGIQYYIVADGGLVKIYTEMGIIGTSIIIFLLVLIYKKSLRKITSVVPEIAVITSAILMSIGSNVLEMELCAPIVYFCLGRAVRIIYDE